MGNKRKINLNTLPLIQNKQHHKTHTNFHFRPTGIKIVGGENDKQECKECHKILLLTAFTTHTPRSDGAYYLRKICRECHTIIYREQVAARKNAPPRPDRCDCCHKDMKLEVDHIHGTTKVRGWICRNCNSGTGALGDTLEGVLQAAIYLEHDIEKIIETLHKVYGEIFARINEKKF